MAGSNLRFEPGYHKKSPETAGSNLRFTLAPVRAAAGSHGSGLPIRRFASSPANRFAGLQPRYVWLSHATPSILLSLAGEHFVNRLFCCLLVDNRLCCCLLVVNRLVCCLLVDNRLFCCLLVDNRLFCCLLVVNRLLCCLLVVNRLFCCLLVVNRLFCCLSATDVISLCQCLQISIYAIRDCFKGSVLDMSCYSESVFCFGEYSIFVGNRGHVFGPKYTESKKV